MKGFVITIVDLPQSVSSAEKTILSGTQHGFPDIEMFTAITPQKNDPHELFKKEKLDPKIFLKNDFSRVESAMSCFLSHYFLWKKCIELNTPIAIFEHDAIFTTQFDHSLGERIRSACNIGRPSFGNFKKSKKTGVQPLFSKKYFPGAHGYIVAPYGAKQFTRYAQVFTPKPTDVFLNKETFSELQEHNPYFVEVQESFSTVQVEKGCKAKYAYQRNPDKYDIIEL